MNYKKDCNKGNYKLTAPEKYLSARPPAYKSSWELHTFVVFERNPNILKWGYESVPIYYYHPFYQKMTVYYPDLWCHLKGANGNEYKMLIEIKPKKFRSPPTKPKEPVRPTKQTPDAIAKYTKAFVKYQKSLKGYEYKMKDFAVNAQKWQAAQAYCVKNNIIWKILDEENAQNFFSEPI